MAAGRSVKQNRSPEDRKLQRKSPPGRSQIDPWSVQNRPPEGPKWASRGLWGPLGGLLASKLNCQRLLWRFGDPTWAPVEANLVQPGWIGFRPMLAPFVKRFSLRFYTSLRRCGNSNNRSFASTRIIISRFRRCEKASKKASKSSLRSNFGSKRPWEACKARFLDDLGVVLGPKIGPRRGPKQS